MIKPWPLIAMAVVATAPFLMQASQAQQSFPTPEQAGAALAEAVKTGTNKAILKVLGGAASDIVDSGDEVADAEMRQRFTNAYDAQHSIRTEGNKKATLVIGDNDFPFPIPLYANRSGWEFDTQAGRREILYRRIGRNELDAIQTCLAYVDAQNEYAGKDRGEGKGAYAQRIVSSPGKTDGLYWPSDANDSPLGQLAAEASAEGYKAGREPKPYHGYYYRILTRQGPSAAGGTLSYIVNGKMIGGFALVAYPASYGNSGVMTFIVNHAGTVYEKDMGENTDATAKAMSSFNPDKSWHTVNAE